MTRHERFYTNSRGFFDYETEDEAWTDCCLSGDRNVGVVRADFLLLEAGKDSLAAVSVED